MKYTITSAESSVTNSFEMASESYNIGAANAYLNIVENDPVSSEYQNRTIVLAEKQFVLAGHRLAHLMTLIFPNSAPATIQEESQIETAPRLFL